MNLHFFTAPFYFAIWFRVQVAASPPFLEDGILVSPFLVSLIACVIIQKGILQRLGVPLFHTEGG